MNTVAGLSDIIPSGLTPRPKASLLRPAINGLARLGARVVEIQQAGKLIDLREVKQFKSGAA